MDIGFYIADLLRNEDEVGLPGLGTFKRERVSASYNASDNSFSPPSYRITLIKELNHLESLVQYVSAKKQISLSSAQYFVQKFASSISDLIATAGQAEVKPLGIISRDNEQLKFETAPDFTIQGEFYGLKPVKDIQHSAAFVNTSDIDQTNPPAVESTIEDFIRGNGDTDLDEEETDGVPAETAPRNRTLLVLLGAFLLAIITVALLYVFNVPTRNRVDNLCTGSAAKNTAVSDDLRKQNAALIAKTRDSINQITPLVQDSSLIDSTLKSKQAAEPIVEATTYEIVGAAFGKRIEAENYIRAMKTKGLQARILEDMPGPLFKVSLSSFTDRPSAQEELNRIVKEVEKQAWITEYKSKQTK